MRQMEDTFGSALQALAYAMQLEDRDSDTSYSLTLDYTEKGPQIALLKSYSTHNEKTVIFRATETFDSQRRLKIESEYLKDMSLEYYGIKAEQTYERDKAQQLLSAVIDRLDKRIYAEQLIPHVKDALTGKNKNELPKIQKKDFSEKPAAVLRQGLSGTFETHAGSEVKAVYGDTLVDAIKTAARETRQSPVDISTEYVSTKLQKIWKR